MAYKDIYLIKFRRTATQRAHFALYIHEGTFPGKGTIVNVIGAPMAGFHLDIRHDYSLANTNQPYTSHHLGQVSAISATSIEQLATTVRPPPISHNFLAPVDGVKNKRCQEWTTELVQLLVQRLLLDKSALDIVESHRDPPSFGIGLKPVGRARGS